MPKLHLVGSLYNTDS